MEVANNVEGTNVLITVISDAVHADTMSADAVPPDSGDVMYAGTTTVGALLPGSGDVMCAGTTTVGAVPPASIETPQK